MLSVCLILGQILGGSLAGGVIASHRDPVLGYRSAYEWFAGIAVAAVLVTLALHAKDRERAEARS